MRNKLFTLFLAVLASCTILNAETYSGTCGENLTWDLTDGVLTISGSGDMTNWSSYSKAPWYSYRENITNVTIGNSVTSIGNLAFDYCSGLTSVDIPNSVTSIGNSAFHDCKGLTSVTIPNSVISIGSGAFFYCSGLTSVTIGNSVTSIGSSAFYHCSNLTSIEIPNSVTSIGHGAFEYCSGLTSVVVANGNTVYDSRDNCNAIIETSTNTLILGCKNTIIPTSVTSIGDDAFYNCSDLTSVTIPNSVTSIGSDAFFYCSGLTSVTIPNSVTSIGNRAFYGCSGLTSMVVENGNTIYDSRDNCNAIIETSTNTLIFGCINTIIPTSVTSIGESAFYGCSGLTRVTIGNSVTSIGNRAFYGCSGLASVTIGNSVTSIGESAFSDCNSLTSVNIPNSVESIGWSAFENSGLVSIVIHDSIGSIGDRAFSQCRDLTFVVCYAPNPPALGESVFRDYYLYGPNDNNNVTLYVPESSIDLYKVAEQWKDFTNILPVSGTEPCITASANITIANIITTLPSCGQTTVDLTGEVIFDSGSGDLVITDLESGKSTTIAEGSWISPQAFTIPDIPADGQIHTIKVEFTGDPCSPRMISYVAPIQPSILLHEPTFCDIDCAAGTYTVKADVTYTNQSGRLYAWLDDDAHKKEVTYIAPEGYVTIEFAGLTGDGLVHMLHIQFDDAFGCEEIFTFTAPFIPVISDVKVTPTQMQCGDATYDVEVTFTVVNGQGEEVTMQGKGLTETFNATEGINSVTFTGVCVSDATDDMFEIWFTYNANCSHMVTTYTPPSEPDDCEPAPCLLASGTCGENLTWELSCDSVLTISGRGKMPEYSSTNETPWCAYKESIISVVIQDGVTSIGEDAFYKCKGLTSITIPNSVTNIGSSAFMDCTGLTNIEIPNSVTSIGECAFENCYRLTSIEIPNNVTNIRGRTFRGCNGLTSVTIPNSVTSIGYSAFDGCSSLMSITIPNGVTSIEYNAFDLCTSLTSIEIPNSVISIGDNAFAYCRGLTSVTIPNSITSIGSSAFLGCSGLTSITIPSGVTSIANNAFSSCSGLISISVESGNPNYDSRDNCNAIIETVTNTLITGCQNTIIPSSVTSIGSSAFSGCSGLTSITIPSGVTSIANGTFSSCSGLISISVESGNPNYDSRDNCNAIIETTTNTLISGCQNTIIPSSITSIGSSAFSGCTSLTSIEIPNSVTSIGSYALNRCSSLSTIINNSTIPQSIGALVFGLMPLTGVNKLTCLLYVPYESVEAYKSANVWKEFTNILPIPGTEPCADYLDVVFNDYATTCSGQPFAWEGEMFIKTVTETTVYDITKTLKTVHDCDSIVTMHLTVHPAYSDIDDYATTFSGEPFVWEGETFIESVTETNEYDYTRTLYTTHGCDSVVTLHLIVTQKPVVTRKEIWTVCPGTTIDWYGQTLTPTETNNVFTQLFEGTEADTLVTLTVTVNPIPNPIEEFAYFCGGESYDWNGNTYTEEGDYTITLTTNDGCEYLATLHLAINPDDCEPAPCLLASGTCGENLTWEMSCEGVLTISGNGEMSNWSSPQNGPWYEYREDITSIFIGNSVTSIGDGAFYECSGMTSVTIPSSVTSIGRDAFYYCSSLTSVTIPNSVTTIGYEAFSWCSGLTNVTIPNSVTSIGDDAFYSCSGLTSVTIPNSITNIGMGAFYNCSGLTSIEIPNSVTSIGAWAFYYCISLTSVTIPNSVTSIGVGAFYDCSGLMSVKSDAITPPELEWNYTYNIGVFDGVNKSIPLYVPGTSIELYRSADQWKDFTNILPIPGTELAEYPVIFLDYNSDVLSEQSVAEGSAAVTPEVPEREGYIFKGWNVDIEHIVARTFAIALYDKVGVEVTYKAEDGETIFSEHADLHIPDAPALEGKTFAGWLTENIDKNGIVLRATYTVDNPTTNDDVTVVPGSNSANVTFPFVTGAITYVLVIRDLFGRVVCKIMFNASGRLLGIAFAPSRERNQQSAQTDNFQFTVEGLDPSTTYEYEFVAHGETDEVIETLVGSFTTTAEIPTDLSDVQGDNVQCSKVVMNDQVLILRGDKTYTVQGQEVR